jgi:hypothetical protein
MVASDIGEFLCLRFVAPKTPLVFRGNLLQGSDPEYLPSALVEIAMLPLIQETAC